MTILTCKTKADIETQMVAYMRRMDHRDEVFVGVPLRGDTPAQTKAYAELAQELSAVFNRIMKSELCDETVEASFLGQYINAPSWGLHTYQITCYEPLTPRIVDWAGMRD